MDTEMKKQNKNKLNDLFRKYPLWLTREIPFPTCSVKSSPGNVSLWERREEKKND